MKQKTGINRGKRKSFKIRKQVKCRTNKFKLASWSNWKDKLLVNPNKDINSEKEQLNKIRKEGY